MSLIKLIFRKTTRYPWGVSECRMKTLMRVLSLIWESYQCLCNITKVISRNVCFNTHFLESEASGGETGNDDSSNFWRVH